MFGGNNVVKIMVKKIVYSGYGIAFDGAGECSFNNDSARNVIIFGVDISLSSHTDKQKNDFSEKFKFKVLFEFAL